MKKTIFVKAWTYAKSLAKKLGGKAVEYFGYSLKMAWRFVKLQLIKSQLTIIKYNKKEDDYQGNYVILGTNLKTKVNKQGGVYLSADTYKGKRNYKFYQLEKAGSIKELNNKIGTLLKNGWVLS